MGRSDSVFQKQHVVYAQEICISNVLQATSRFFEWCSSLKPVFILKRYFQFLRTHLYTSKLKKNSEELIQTIFEFNHEANGHNSNLYKG